MDAIKYVTGLVLAIIVISIVMGFLYMIAGNWEEQTRDSSTQNSNLLDCVQESDMSYAQCKDQYSESAPPPVQPKIVKGVPP